MASKRRFFDWSEPFLPSVARYIVEELSTPNASGTRTLDLGRYVFIVSGGRAKRSLEAYVQTEVDRAIADGRISNDWTPPSYALASGAPELLYESDYPHADALAKLYCERRALRKFFETDPRAATLAANPYESDDANAEFLLARTFLALDQQLADDRRGYLDVARVCEEREAPEEAERWRALDALSTLYREELRRAKLRDQNDAREYAIRHNRIGGGARDSYNGAPKEYRVVGAVDIALQQAAVFAALGERVEFWIFAPESEAERFDEYGRAIPDAWQKFEPPIPDENFFQVESPVEEGEIVALLARELSKKYDRTDSDGRPDWRYDPIDPETLTIGVPDDEVAPFVEEQLAALGYSTIRAEGSPITGNRAYALLANVAEYLETRSYEALGDLLRRPDVETYLARKWKFVASPKLEERASDAADTNETPLDRLERERRAQALAELEELEAEEAESGGEVAFEPIENEEKRVPAPICEFDEYRARFLPTRTPTRWFEYVDADNVKRANFFQDLRKASRIIDMALAEFRDELRPDRGAPARASVEPETDLDELKLSNADFDRARELARRSFTAPDDAPRLFSRSSVGLTRRPFRDWAGVLSRFMSEIYGETFDASGRTRAATSEIAGFFKEFSSALDSLSALPKDEETTGATAIRAVLAQLATRRIPPLPGSKTVELQGWLDLIFDDAPYLILTGFNERFIPSTRATEMFLPNETRRALGMSDARRTFARDAYLTTCLAHSRDAFFVVFARKTLQGDPNMASRFVFAVDREKVPGRVARFFGRNVRDDLRILRDRQRGRAFPKRGDADATVDSLDALARKSALAAETQRERDRAARKSIVEAPTLLFRGPCPVVMKVTEFESFLNGPYRYFLRYAFNLQQVPTVVPGELNAAEFGTLVHDVLRDFGLDPNIRDSVSEEAIFAWLSKRLDARADRAYDDYASPFVFVQIEQIRARLRGFASWQAAWRATGREIRYVEIAPSDGGVALDVGLDAPAYVKGRIDRIDYCKSEGRWYVFDYKTYDSWKKGGTKSNSTDAEHVVSRGDERDLLTSRLGNTVDERHRERASERPLTEAFCRKYGIELGGKDGEGKPRRWTNLQLPLYRLLARRLLKEREPERSEEPITLGYVGVSNGTVEAYGAPWTEYDLQCAEATARWVVRTIRRIWASGELSPNTRIDPEYEFGVALPSFTENYEDEFGAITLSALED